MLPAAFLLTTLLACSGAPGDQVGTPAEPDPPPAAPAPAPEPAKVDAATAEKAVTPSPLALQQQVVQAGVADGLGGLVPASRFSRETSNPDTVAIRTGIRIADAVLAGNSDSKEAFLARLAEIRAGLETMGMGQGRLSEIDDFIKEVRNDTASRQDFVAELDQVVSEMVPQEGWGPGDTTGPLLQAGAWLAGTNLVARAVVARGDDAAADALLKRPAVPAYFLAWARSEGAKKTNAPTLEQVEQTLVKLNEITGKDSLGVKDAQAIVDATSGLFDWL